MRPVVSDALAAGLRPAIYGAGWDGLVAPELVVADHVDNEDLPVVYSSAGVVLNQTASKIPRPLRSRLSNW